MLKYSERKNGGMVLVKDNQHLINEAIKASNAYQKAKTSLWIKLSVVLHAEAFFKAKIGKLPSDIIIVCEDLRSAQEEATLKRELVLLNLDKIFVFARYSGATLLVRWCYGKEVTLNKISVTNKAFNPTKWIRVSFSGMRKMESLWEVEL